ncbi:hypothetical protein SUDANB176_07835 (plasmid) [Streptomyces sp. enrichment culture]|uniref:hypothetical protein n=1 Tax=Streptomyces sp. enrichment culture TaxID=1795815 RepID=UPI003F55F265
MGLHWAWYALALVGAYRMTAAGLDAAVRRIVRTASLARDEHRHHARLSAPTAPAHPAVPTAQSMGLPFDPGLTAALQEQEER